MSSIGFGDSVMKGVQYIQGKYQVCADSFVRSGAQSVDARCRFGSTSEKGLELLRRETARIAPGQAVLLEYGGNDSDFDWDAVAARPQEPHKPNVSIARFERDLREMLALVRECGAQPALMTLPPVDPYRYFDHIAQNRDAGRLMQWLGRKERIYTFQEQYSLAVCRTAARCDAPVADVRARFLELDDFLPYLSDDGIHPNERGHALIAETLRAFYAATA